MFSTLRPGSQFPTLLPIFLPCFHLSRWILAIALIESISMWVFTAWAPSRRSFLGTIDWSLSRREAVEWYLWSSGVSEKWTSPCKHISILIASYGTQVAQMSRDITGCRSISWTGFKPSSPHKEELIADHLIALLLSALTIHMSLNLLPITVRNNCRRMIMGLNLTYYFQAVGVSTNFFFRDRWRKNSLLMLTKELPTDYIYIHC